MTEQGKTALFSEKEREALELLRQYIHLNSADLEGQMDAMKLFDRLQRHIGVLSADGYKRQLYVIENQLAGLETCLDSKPTPNQTNVLSFAGFDLYPDHHLKTPYSDELKPLTPTEYPLLRELLLTPESYVPYLKFVQVGWNSNDLNLYKGNLTVNIAILRRKVDSPRRDRQKSNISTSHIQPKYGYGYVFRGQPQQIP